MCNSCNEGAEVIHLHAHSYIGLGIEKRHRQLSESDELIAKVLMISEVARIARIEVNLRKFMEAKWELRQSQAISKATSMAKQLKKSTEIANAIHTIMNMWRDDVGDHVQKEQARIYKLAREVGWKKATGQTKASLTYNSPHLKDEPEPGQEVRKAKFAPKPSFNLVDKDAVEALNEQQMFWIGKHYDDNVKQSINDITRKSMIEAGNNRKTAGALIGKHVKDNLTHVRTPTGFVGTSAQYFEGLAANAATVARVYGQLRSFMEIGITRYTISNPGGSRTCPSCALLNGKVFTVQHAVQQMEQELQAKSPEDIKSIHPWKTPAQVKAISPKAGPQPGAAGRKDADNLAAAGLSYPPYHFRCRCTVDVDPSQSYGELEPVSPPTRKSPAVSKKPVVTPKPKAKPRAKKPKASFSETAMKTALSAFRPTMASSSVEAAAIRSNLDALLAKNGLNNTGKILDQTGKAWYETQQSLAGASGLHNFGNGSIQLTNASHEGAAAFMAGNRTPNSLYGMKVLIHEGVHGASPIGGWAYKGGAAVVEEVTTEVTARHVMQTTFNLTAKQMKAAGTNYNKFISKVRSAIYNNMGYKSQGFEGLDAAEKALTKAAVAMRSDPTMKTKSKIIWDQDKYMKFFADKVEPAAGVSEAAAAAGRKKLVSEISKMELD